MKKFLALLLLPICVNADPGLAAKYLTDESASLLDIGMLRLHILASEFRNSVGLYWTDEGEYHFFRADINTSYVREENKVYISISAMNSEPTEKQMEEGCRTSMAQMNIWLQKTLPDLFLHAGYEYGDPTVPSDIYEQIRNMFEIRCTFFSPQSTAEGRFWASRTLGPLGDDQMKIGKWRMSNEPKQITPPH